MRFYSQRSGFKRLRDASLPLKENYHPLSEHQLAFVEHRSYYLSLCIVIVANPVAVRVFITCLYLYGHLLTYITLMSVE